VSSDSKPLIIIIPGLMSTVEDHYNHTFIDKAEKNGYDWLLVNYRGITHPMRNTLPFHAADFSSFKEVILEVTKQLDCA